MAHRRAVNRQVRGFAFIWTGVTVVIGLAAFLSIYLAYSPTANADTQNQDGVSLPAQETEEAPTQAPAQVVNTPIPVPTTAPSPTPMVMQETQGVAIAQAEPSAQPAMPTPLPIYDTSYQVGIQVQFSITYNAEYQAGWFNDVKGMGLSWYKQQVRWKDTEAEGKGIYDWGVLDLTLPLASEMGLKALVSVVGAPDWAREPGTDLEKEGPPANMQDFADFLTAMLQRYPGMIHAIEVWNEPNIDREWNSTGGVSAANYVEMLQTAYIAIKNVDPGVIVISGAPSPTGGASENGVPVAIDDFDYLDGLISSGLLNYTDCVGVHHNGYNIGPSVTWDEVENDPDAFFRGPFDGPHHSWSFRSTLQTYANKIAVAGGTQRLCITEFGWATVEDLDGAPRQGFEFAVDNTLEEQAQWTVEALQNMHDWGIVWIATIWNLNYGPQAGFSPENDNVAYSFLGPDGQRPVMAAVRAWSNQRNQ